MHQVYLSLGSNIEPRAEQIQRARDWLAERHSVVAVSSLYETEPLGPGEQSWHINQVIELATSSTADEILADCLAAERMIGRQPREKWGPREIDIDILLFDSLVLDTVGLHIPHPELPNRKFILAPLAEIAPNVMYTRTQQTIQQLLDACPDTLQVKLYQSI